MKLSLLTAARGRGITPPRLRCGKRWKSAARSANVRDALAFLGDNVSDAITGAFVILRSRRARVRVYVRRRGVHRSDKRKSPSTLPTRSMRRPPPLSEEEEVDAASARISFPRRR
jgi:hypothetical protein